MTVKELNVKSMDIENCLKELFPTLRAIDDLVKPEDYEKHPAFMKELCEEQIFTFSGEAHFKLGGLQFLFQDFVKQVEAYVKQEQIRRRP